jgi:phosphoribosylglycinamide formyltransferase 1
VTGTAAKPLSVVVLVSGRGSNLQAIIDAANDDLPAVVAAVVSNDPEAFALVRARRAGIATHAVDHRRYADRAAFEGALCQVIDAHEPDLVVLAGFMRILTADFVSRYHHRLINIHPSLLPEFPGLNTHQRALDAGRAEHGATVHFVSADVDAGPIIIQARVPVLAGDDAGILAARVLEQEHRILPQAIHWFAEKRLSIRDDAVLLDGQPAHPRP